MLKSCQYCGRVHDERYQCKARAEAIERRNAFYDKNRRGRNKETDSFRRSYKWQRMREHIIHRDRALCLCCLAELEGTTNKYNTENLSVHHITPLVDDYGKRLDEDNLITVCGYHHEACEKGAIPKDVQRELVKRSYQGKL